METINEKYPIEITVLSPLSIGAGAEKDLIKGVDFVVKNNLVYMLNMKKMIQHGIDIQSMTTYFASKNTDAILKMVESKLNDVCDVQFELPVNSDNDIKSFIKNELSGKPIIPGSSLKGAVRSVILHYLLGDKKPEKLAEKDYFGSSTKGDELMRFIKFSDAEFEKTSFVNTKIFNLRNDKSGWKGGWKHSVRETTEIFKNFGFNTLYESILPEQNGVCSIMLSKTAFDNFGKNNTHIMKSEKEKLFSIKELFRIVNEHTRKYLEKEINFFKKYETDKTDHIIRSLEHINEQIPEDNSACILKMSAGSGFHSITGDWQYDDYSKTGIANNGRQKYKSRKIAIHNDCFSLMGFVKLQPVSEEEIEKRREIQAEKKRQIEALKRSEQENIEKEKKKAAEYNDLIAKAKTLFDGNQFGEAKSRLEQAKTLVPDGKNHSELLAKVEEIISQQEADAAREKTIIANQQKAEADRLAANQVPLSEKLKTSNKIPTMAGNIKTWMKLNNIQSLSETDIEVIHTKVKKIYDSLRGRDRKDFSLNPLLEVVNKTLIDQWLNEIKS